MWFSLILISAFIILPLAIMVLPHMEAVNPDPIVSIAGSNQDDLFGWNISDAGDVNGDGFEDIIVGAPGYDSNRGAIFPQITQILQSAVVPRVIGSGGMWTGALTSTTTSTMTL
jgi:hypothetical protein